MAFGTSYVSEDNLELECFYFFPRGFHHGFEKLNVDFSLRATEDHYYIILNNRLKVCASGPPLRLEINIRVNTTENKSICLTPINEWLLQLDPFRNEKRFILGTFTEE